MDSRTFKGEWWSPESPEDKVPGIVEYHPERGEAELFGTLIEADHNEDIPLMEMDFEEYIDGALLGETTDSELVTIADAVLTHVSGSSIGGPGLPDSEYQFTRLYVGGQFDEEPEFSQVSFGFDGLAEWFDESRIRWEIPDDDDLRSRYKVKEPKEFEIELPDADVSFLVGTRSSSSSTRKELEDSVSVNIKPDDSLTFPTLKARYIKPLQRYLALATATPVQPADISGTVGDETRVDILSNIPSYAPEDRSVNQVSMSFPMMLTLSRVCSTGFRMKRRRSICSISTSARSTTNIYSYSISFYRSLSG